MQGRHPPGWAAPEWEARRAGRTVALWDATGHTYTYNGSYAGHAIEWPRAVVFRSLRESTGHQSGMASRRQLMKWPDATRGSEACFGEAKQQASARAGCQR